MLKLIKCEFWKLKRKRLLYALMSLSLFFPLILAYMAKAGTGADTTEHYLQTRFDYVYTMMLGYGLVFLLPWPLSSPRLTHEVSSVPPLCKAPSSRFFSDIDKFLINSGFCHKLIMGSLFANLSIRDYQNLICLPDGIQPMCNYK